MLKAAISVILLTLVQNAVQQHIDAAKKAAGTQWSAAFMDVMTECMKAAIARK